MHIDDIKMSAKNKKELQNLRQSIVILCQIYNFVSQIRGSNIRYSYILER